MRRTIWMPLYIGDFLKAAHDLDLAERGAYLNLLIQYWLHGPLPIDSERLRRLAGMSGREWHVSSARLLRDFEIRTHADVRLYHHDQLDALITKRDKKIGRAQQAARIRWGMPEE